MNALVTRALLAAPLLAVLGGCAASSPPAPARADASIDRITIIHGGAGPWVVAGYRMGERALQVLGLSRGSFDLEVVHHAPRKVQYTCIADGAAASTGASLGKLNLSLAEAESSETRTTYRNRANGQSVTLRVTQAFVARYLDVSRGDLERAGREVLSLPDDQIFEQVR